MLITGLFTTEVSAATFVSMVGSRSLWPPYSQFSSRLSQTRPIFGDYYGDSFLCLRVEVGHV